MSLGTILVIILIIFLLGGFSGRFGGYGYGFGGGLVRAHHGHRFIFFGDPFYDPFFYSWYIPPSVPVPYKTVTFSNGRVVSFQYLMNPRR